jgi:hypothetical protein
MMMMMMMMIIIIIIIIIIGLVSRCVDRYSSVGIATRYRLEGPEIESQ